MSAFSQRVDAARNGGTMNIEQEKPAAVVAAGIGMGRESAFTRAVRNARGGTLDEVEMPQAKTPVDPEPGFWQRVFKTASGGVKQSASQYSDAARAQYEAGQGGRTQRTMDELRDIEWAVANAKYAYDTAATPGAKRALQNDLDANLTKLKAYAEVLGEGAYDVVLREAYDAAGKLAGGDAKSIYAGLAGFDPDAFNGVQQQATAATAQMADQLQKSSGTDIAQAKQGLGAVGQTLVDAGVAGTQMLGDAAANLIAPGMSKVAMAQRVFGGGTQEARQHGANLAQQMGYGAANAALELLTESMFDGLAGIYGGGAADDVVEAFIQKATGSPAGRAALRVLAGAAGEGAEELVSGIVNPFLQTIYNSDALRESYGKGNLKETVSGILHDALIGTILGTVGGGANAVKSYGADAKTAATPDGAALGAEAAANGESATTATPAEEKAAEAIVVGERTTAAERPADPLLAAIINTQQQKTTPQNVETPESFDSEGAGDYTGEYRGEFAADGQPLFARTRDEAQIESTDFGALKKRQDATDIKYGIGAEDSASLRNYIKATFYMLNKRMRNGESAQDSAVVQRITSALKKFPTYAGRTYRNLAFANESEYQAFLEEYAAGNRTVLKAFTSTSKRPNGYPKFGKFVVHMALDCDSGADIAETYGMPRQQEVILLPGTEIEVVDVTTANDGNPLIIAREVANHGQGEVSADRESQRGTATDFHGGRTVGTGDGRSSAGVREAARGDAGRHGLLPERGRRDVGSVDAESSVGAAEHGFDPFTAAQNEHGTLPSGEHPVRPDDVPVSVGGKDRVSQTVRTVIGAKVTPEEFVPLIENETMNGEFSYMRLSNDAVTDAVVREITDKSWETALRDWRVSAKAGKSGPHETAMGAMLYNHAVNAGDFQLAMDILVEYQGMVRSSARALQAARILKKLSPDKQLYMAQRSIGNLQEELNERYGRENAPELTVSNELYERFRKAATQEARDDAMRDIYRSVGKQMPSRFVDKWNAWRYLSMLGNARTHIRNIVGNAVFAPVVGAKTGIATGIEAVAYRLSGGKLERTKAPIAKELWRAALADYDNAQEAIQSGRKYGEMENANRYVEEGRTIFKAKPLEWARKKNSELLDVEDAWFSRPQYALALAQYCAANGITAEQLQSGEVLTKARDYAIREAQKATFRDTNYLSQTLVDLGQYEGKNPAKKIVSVLTQGLLPFRKTPADILARGLEYSPLGFLGVAHDAARKAASGTKLAKRKDMVGKWARGGREITGADIIDHLAAGLTGSGLFALGAWLAAEGLVRGADDEDEEQAAFDDLTGHQAYALELPDGTSITLDWLAPESMPFFMGVNMAQMQGEDGKPLTLRQMMTVAERMTDPLLEMSCLQSLNDAFDAVGHATDSGMQGVSAFLATMALSYLTQAVPTLFGQVERISEDVRYTTYTGEGAQWSDQLTNDAQYNLGKMLQRVPRLDYSQIPYIDAWGREEETGDVLERAAHNLFNPAYVSQVDVDKLESELQRLYDATGDVAVLPDRAAKSFTMDGETRYLTAEEYVQFAKASGQDSYRYASEAVQSAAYRSMSDEERAELIGKLYSYAKYKAKKGVEPKYESKTYQKARDAEEKGISPVEYFAMKAEIDHDGNGSTTQSEAQRYLDGANMTRQEKAFVWTLINKDWKHNPYT